jgi:hypothetical protein
MVVAPALAEERKSGDPVPLTLSPAAAPAPSLKYQLLPDESELQPGNAAALYYRAIALLSENSQLAKELRSEDWRRWQQAPLAQLRHADVREKLFLARSLLHEIDVAARQRQCDWQLAGRPEGIGLLIPEVNGLRMVGWVLAVRARYEMAEGKLSDTLYTLRTGFALARHLSEGPTFIHALVGAVVAHALAAELETFVQQPGAPNLYWALVTLPRPLIETRAALREEGTMLERGLPGLKLLEKGPATPAQVEAVMKQMDGYIDSFQVRRPPLYLVRRVADMAREYPEARRFLLAQGFTAAQIEAMPVTQPVILYAFQTYRRAWEEGAKWSHVAGGFQHPGYRKAVAAHRQAMERLDRLFFMGLLKALSNGDGSVLEMVFGATGRVDRHLAALACVEALRLHAAGHDGALPATLTDLSEAPAPPDPMTGKPFEYQRNGVTAKLDAPAPPGPPPPPAHRLRYELTMKK